MSNMNVILCGMMGCGKSTVGVILAKKINCKCVDTDVLIEERYGGIAELFERCGEEYFRGLETEILKELITKEGLVLSMGGGILLREENRKLLQRMGKMVYLRADVNTLASRLEADVKRPLLQSGKFLKERLKSLMETRSSIYEGSADIVVDVDGKTPEEISDEIIKEIGQV